MDDDKFAWGGEAITVRTPDPDPVQTEIARIDALLGATFTDAGPSTLYVSRKVLNGADIALWAKQQGIPELLAAADLHVTIAYSTKPVDWMEMGAPWEETMELPAGGPRVLEVFGEGAIVLRFASSALKWRHDEIVQAGATWDHPQYSPHITVGKGELPAGAVPYTGRIHLGPEIFEEVKTS